ncbi:hypothetical protein [Anaerobacillus arseniciselenatis]|uniref:hypothetical protein n=1 Tax=Anaerobacillus arseniciselenatis TaxID=85682 RepID=UPI0011145A1E|nr:hypothetical protein [Anaerobacillus arseniciselenatis]
MLISKFNISCSIELAPAVTRRTKTPAPAVTRRTKTPAPAVTRRTKTPAPAVTRRKAARSNTEKKSHDAI